MLKTLPYRKCFEKWLQNVSSCHIFRDIFITEIFSTLLAYPVYKTLQKNTNHS